MSLSNILFFMIFIIISECEEHLHVNGPFGKVHLKSDMLIPLKHNGSISMLSHSNSSISVKITDLKVSSTNYSNGDTIYVSWTSTSISCKDDIIGIYFIEVPLTTGVYDYVDYEFVKVNENNSTWLMINLRRQLEFRYYSRVNNCSGNYIFVAKSVVVQPINVNEATQVHLAFGDKNDEIYVSYVTNSSEIIPQCQYGLNPSLLNFEVSGTTISYSASDMCESPANITGPRTFINPGYMHTMLLTDLRPSIIYYYRVGSNEHGWSSIYSFLNRPSNGDETVNLIAYGDMGVPPVQPGAQATIDRVEAKVISMNVTAILHIGDVSYAEGVGSLWDGFMNQIESTTSRVPYMVGIGNHEYDHITGGSKDPSGAPGPGGFRPSWGDYGSDSGGECAVPIVHRFHSPSNGNGLFWYSFDVGPVHIVYYSTEHDFLPSSPQYIWLEKDLSSVNRTRTPWIIVGQHRPIYYSVIPTGISIKLIKSIKETTTTMLQLYIEPLLYKYKVDLCLVAHIHSYERTCPVYQNKCIKDGVTHVLIGMGGHELTNGFYLPVPWSIYHDIQFGYTYITANRTYLTFNYHHTSDDKIADQFSLNK